MRAISCFSPSFEDRAFDALDFGVTAPGAIDNLPNLRTNGGADFQAGVMGNTASTGTGAYAAANYIGLTANATAPAATDTTLTGEVTTGSLARAQAAYSHTTSAASYTLQKTFTSDQSVTIAKIGVFNASAAGTMVFETLLNATATLVSGDQLTVTETVSL